MSLVNRYVQETAAKLDALWNEKFGAWRRFWSARFQDAAAKPNLSFWCGFGALAVAFGLGGLFL